MERISRSALSGRDYLSWQTCVEKTIGLLQLSEGNQVPFRRHSLIFILGLEFANATWPGPGPGFTVFCSSITACMREISQWRSKPWQSLLYQASFLSRTTWAGVGFCQSEPGPELPEREAQILWYHSLELTRTHFGRKFNLGFYS